MALNFKDKQAIVMEVSEIAQQALSIVIADNCGISVDKMNKLRKNGREVGVDMRVVPNTLLRRIAKISDFECLKEFFLGPTLIAFSKNHPGAAARLFKEFAKENMTFKVKAATFEGKLISGEQIESLARLPTYKEALAQFIKTLQEAAIGKLIRILAALRDAATT
ncbi:MAG: 50S ribosomal protein L10 [Candidatus Dasytiphilus stammeri]